MDSKNCAITGHGYQIVKPSCAVSSKVRSDFVARCGEVVCNSIVDFMDMTLFIFKRVICLRCKLQRVLGRHEGCG